MDLFLYDNGLRHERVKSVFPQCTLIYMLSYLKIDLTVYVLLADVVPI